MKYKGFNHTTTRKKEIKIERKYPWICGTYSVVAVCDAIAPGWKRAYVHEIVGASDETGTSPDLVYELPGRIFIRGWDFTGAICKREDEKKAKERKTRKLLRHV